MSNTIADSINPNQDNLLDFQKLIQSDSDTSVSVSSDSPVQNIMPTLSQSIYNQLPPEISQYQTLMNNYPIMNNYNQIPQMPPQIPQQYNFSPVTKSVTKIETTIDSPRQNEVNSGFTSGRKNIVETSEVIEEIIAENKKKSSKDASESKSDETLISSILGGYITIKGIAISNTTILIAIMFIFFVGLYIWWSSKKEKLEKEKDKKREPLVTYNQQKRLI